jgi:hypothetical protein
MILSKTMSQISKYQDSNVIDFTIGNRSTAIPNFWQIHCPFRYEFLMNIAKTFEKLYVTQYTKKPIISNVCMNILSSPAIKAVLPLLLVSSIFV